VYGKTGIRVSMAFAVAMMTIATATAQGQTPAKPPRWMNTKLSADARASALAQMMTLDEKIALLHGHSPLLWKEDPPDLLWASGYVAGVPRLGIPALRETDAGLGVTNPLGKRRDQGSTVLPSGMAVAATWDPALARDGGAMLGTEAHANGFNVVLAGGINLARDPRGGRNFEYAGEDPLLAGVTVGNVVAGIQSQNEISTLKHYALNDQETGRFIADVQIDESAARESDLLAFELAIEGGSPGSIMCSYNKVWTVYACENDGLLNKVLKQDWHYPGFVMSDWGGTHSTEMAAINGLDQEDGEVFDGIPISRRRLPPRFRPDASRRRVSTTWCIAFCVRCSRKGCSTIRQWRRSSTMMPTARCPSASPKAPSCFSRTPMRACRLQPIWRAWSSSAVMRMRVFSAAAEARRK
jgi:beta-glucosidase